MMAEPAEQRPDQADPDRSESSPESSSERSADGPPPAGPAPVDGDEGDALRHSLLSLSRLGTNQMGLEELLTRVAGYAVRAIPGADGAGLTLQEQDRPDTVVTTADFAREIETIQYSLGEGPCITAAHEAHTVVSGSLGADPRWRRFGGAVARLGVHSVVSLPLVTTAGVVGAMNVYAHAKHAFDDRAAEIGEIYAAPAAVAVQNAQALAQTQRHAARLQTALETRAVIEQAIGILLSRGGGNELQALNRLRALSQHDHAKLSEVARRIVDEAIRRAEARKHTN
jgi:hypothetical protein